MKKFRFIGETEVVYPDIAIPGEGSLVAHPGDEREFEQAPDLHWWVEIVNPVKPHKAVKE